ncbi:nitroreductase/quinone reductase family protein [Microtetraspora niveoalba]|uniref:nitroreductase/quinone reductase family protein n=1 Tax=Microtetraspora niveoalba TaxID=46175 RepID=UPI0008376234|nr:nitroreductase/quinone reductase family protein [Microtetraspora niveoalba]
MTEQRPGPSDFNKQVIEEFRANGGAVGGMFEGAPLILLTTTGARSGRPHTNPAVYLRDRERILVFGSNAGRPKNPDWYHNLLAAPRCTVEIGTEDGRIDTYAATAEPVEGEERDRLYAIQCARDPAFAAYQAGTSRTIPVIALTRVAITADEERNQAIAQFLLRVHAELRADLAAIRTEVEDYFTARQVTGQVIPYGTARPRLSRRLAQHCLLFCDALHGHHTNEDRAFADFEKQFPHLAPALDRLRKEHRVVAEAVSELQALLATLTSEADDVSADISAGISTDVSSDMSAGISTDMSAPEARDTTASGTGPTPAPVPGTTISATFLADLERLASQLEEHFAYEEARLIPALTAAPPRAR